MSNKRLNIIFIISSVLVVGGLSFFFYKKHQEKKISEIYKKSVQEMEMKYGNNLFN